MLKKSILLIVILMSLLFFWILIGPYSLPKYVSIRPVNIKVIDSLTKEPINNLLVYYRLRTRFDDNILFLIPNPFPRTYPKSKKICEYHTDVNGELKIFGRKLFLYFEENIYDENIVINLELKNDYLENAVDKRNLFFDYFNIQESANIEKFFHPNKEFNGFVISNELGYINPEKWGGSKRKNFKILWNSNSLSKERDTITIELDRK